MKDGRGSIALIIMVWMSLLSLLGLALCSLTATVFLTSARSVSSACAYYAAEAGIERAASITEQSIRSAVEGIRDEALAKYRDGLLDMDGDRGIISYIDSAAGTYLFNFIYGGGSDYFKSMIGKFAGESGCDAGGGNYYTVTAVIDYSFANGPAEKAVKFVSKGYGGGGARTISGWYTISFPSKLCAANAYAGYGSEILSRSLTVSGTRALTIPGRIELIGSAYIRSSHLIFKDTVLSVIGGAQIKARTVDFKGRVDLKGSLCFDYGDIALSDVHLNGMRVASIGHGSVPECEVYPLGGFPTDSGCGVEYLVFEDDAAVDSSVVGRYSGSSLVIIARKDLLLTDIYGSGLIFNGIIYCNGNLKIEAAKLTVNGSVACGSCDIGGDVRIAGMGAFSAEQTGEIAQKIERSAQSGNLYVDGEFEFACGRWQE